jgi:hypothetical protein
MLLIMLCNIESEKNYRVSLEHVYGTGNEVTKSIRTRAININLQSMSPRDEHRLRCRGKLIKIFFNIELSIIHVFG